MMRLSIAASLALASSAAARTFTVCDALLRRVSSLTVVQPRRSSTLVPSLFGMFSIFDVPTTNSTFRQQARGNVAKLVSWRSLNKNPDVH